LTDQYVLKWQKISLHKPIKAVHYKDDYATLVVPLLSKHCSRQQWIS